MFQVIPKTYRSLTPQRQTEFAILGSYTALCWLLSAVGTAWLVVDTTSSVAYAILAPVFIEFLALAGTALYVRGSDLALTWLRFLVAPALVVSVAHALAVSTPLAWQAQYGAGLFLAVLFAYGQIYVDHAMRYSAENARIAQQAAIDAARLALAHEQAQALAQAELAVQRLAHYGEIQQLVREKLVEAVHPAASFAIGHTTAMCSDEENEPPRLGFSVRNSIYRVATHSSRSQNGDRTCKYCGAASLTASEIMAHGRNYKRHGQCQKPEN